MPSPEGEAPAAPVEGGGNQFEQLLQFVGNALDAMKQAMGQAGGQVPPEALSKLEGVSAAYDDFIASVGGQKVGAEEAPEEEMMMKEEEMPMKKPMGGRVGMNQGVGNTKPMM